MDNVAEPVDQSKPANVGLLVGLMVLVIIVLVIAVVIYHKKNAMLKTELNGPEVFFLFFERIINFPKPLEMAPVLSAGENVYEDIGPESQIVRNLIRTESQVSSILTRASSFCSKSALHLIRASGGG